MANNLRVFNTNSDYQSADLVHPAVSYVIETDKVIYEPTPPTPPVFQGKWKATYSNGNVTSAECGSSSKITYNEINLTNLVSVEIGNCVTSIGDWAFVNCRSLTSVTCLATTPPTLGIGTFDGSTCTIYVPCESVEAYKSASDWSYYASRITCIQPSFKWLATYGSNITASAECSSNTTIASYDIPNTKGTNKDIESVIVGDCVTTIGQSAFNGYTTLTSCTIGSGVTSIGSRAFEGCRRLKSITIPDSVTSIGRDAFEYCSGMTDATIGSGVTSIGDWAFQTHNNMNSITITAQTPPTLGTAPFLNTGNCPIYVPAESVGAYKGGTWSAYASRIQPIP